MQKRPARAGLSGPRVAWTRGTQTLDLVDALEALFTASVAAYGALCRSPRMAVRE